MSKSAGAVRNGLVLRLSLPATGEMRSIASDIASKIADQFGVKTPDGGLEQAIDELATRVDPSEDGEIAFEFHKLDRELKIEARSGSRASEARVPISA